MALPASTTSRSSVRDLEQSPRSTPQVLPHRRSCANPMGGTAILLVRDRRSASVSTSRVASRPHARGKPDPFRARGGRSRCDWPSARRWSAFSDFGTPGAINVCPRRPCARCSCQAPTATGSRSTIRPGRGQQKRPRRSAAGPSILEDIGSALGGVSLAQLGEFVLDLELLALQRGDQHVVVLRCFISSSIWRSSS